ncbi:MAG: hypothetical protein ACTTJ7_02645 [Treponema sp.]
MKKIVMFFFCVMLISVNIFAESDSSTAEKGNGGKNKIGGWLGLPYIGVSYSHEFNDFMEFDLLAGVSGVPFVARSLNVRTGVLFTVWEPIINGQKCPLKVGPAVDINSFMTFFVPVSFGAKILCPVRWEVNFSGAPAFNLFIEAAPAIGGQLIFGALPIIDFVPHVGLGLRYRIPNKK